MEEYLTRFDGAVHACERAEVGVPHELLAHQVLQQANLTHDQATVVMSTVKADALTRGVVTYREMQAALTLLHGQRAKAWAGTGSFASVTLTVAEHRALVAAAGRAPTGGTTAKTPDSSKPKCWHCKEVGHLRRDCPARSRQPQTAVDEVAAQEERALFTSCSVRSAMVCVSDCLTGHAIIDPGATATVAGERWVRAYKGALHPDERATCRVEPADVLFRFGDGVGQACKTVAFIPICIGGGGYQLRVHVVPGDLPLLLSLVSLRRARAVLDLEANTIFLKDSGVTVPLRVNKAGHLTLLVLPRTAPGAPPAHSTLAAAVEPTTGSSSRAPPPAIVPGQANLSSVAERLHRTYGHAGAGRLSHMLHTAGCSDPALHAAVAAAVSKCRACQLAEPAPHHPVVALPRSSRFNETVAMDLASIRGLGTFAHFIDLGTRLSRCVAIPNKLGPTVVRAFLDTWICVYGAPRVVLGDGGGEFQSDLFRLLGERFNITVTATAAQAAWSNGICERHNAVVKRTVETLQSDYPDATFQDLLSHAAFSKNNLAVHNAATPFQLVTGSLPRLPSILSDNLPAMHTLGAREDGHLLTTLNMLASSRAAFSRAEADQSLRRALNRPPDRNSNAVWPLGTLVDYWVDDLNPDRRGWRGPATVAGQAGKQVRLRHGATWTTRHSKCLRLRPSVPDELPHSAPGAVGRRTDLSDTAGRSSRAPTSADPDHPPADQAPRREAVSDMLQRAAAAVQANALVSDVKTKPPAVLCSDDCDQDSRSSTPPALGRLTGAALVHSLCANRANLQAELEKLHAQWHHLSAAGTRARLWMNGVRDDAVLEMAQEVADYCAECGGRSSDNHPTTSSSAQSDSAVRNDARSLPTHQATDGHVPEQDAMHDYAALITRREQRRRTEVPVAEAGRRFDKPMDSELDAWAEQSVYNQVRDVGQRVLSTRWVYTIKSPQLPGDPPKLKARLCERGFEDPQRANVDRVSPTVSRASVRLVLAATVTFGWVPRTVDVSTAFLQGMPIDRPAPVYVRPPPYARVPPGLVWKLNKCAYGLTDAPRMWYKRVVEVLESVGAERAVGDHGVFTMHKDGKLVLLVAVHVDDFLFSGTTDGVTAFERGLRNAFTVGPTVVGSFTFTGLRVVTRFSGRGPSTEVTVDQDAYIDSIDDIDIEPHRARDKGLAVNPAELTEYRRATGALLWATGQTVPHLACATALLARRFKDARVTDLVRANKVIRQMRQARGVPLLFLPAPSPRHLVLFTDSSAVTIRAPVSQAGYAIFLTSSAAGSDGRVPDGLGRSTMVAWGSHRQRRVTHSSFAAEAFALLHGLQAALTLASVAGALLGGADQVPPSVHVVTDSLGVYDALSSRCETGSKEVRAVVEDLRDYYTSGALASITWMPGRFQLADGLTKATGANNLRAAIAAGALTLRCATAKTKRADNDPGCDKLADAQADGATTDDAQEDDGAADVLPSPN